ncbi:MAG: glycosyltransferase family 2 protein, partial [Pleurocapsa sp.]
PHPGDCEASRRHRSKWRIEEKTPYQNQRIEEVSDRLKREPTSFVEFHSMLVRTEIFEEIGMLDERFCCTKEYIDFCMNVTSA